VALSCDDITPELQFGAVLPIFPSPKSLHYSIAIATGVTEYRHLRVLLSSVLAFTGAISLSPARS
jgi:hypothetical protein